MSYRAVLEGAMQSVRWGADRVLDRLQAYGQEGVPKFNYMTGGYSLKDIMPYGNYWIAEYLYRELAPDWGILSLRY